MALTESTHQLIREHFADTDLSNKVAIDATCGNGHDTIFLTQLGFGKILAFDIQTLALENTQKQLNESQIENVELIHDSHENLNSYLNTEVDCVMFNLGYLPNGDKAIATKESTSIMAIDTSLQKLSKGGLISILCYPGHEQGATETKAIQTWLRDIDSDWQVNETLASHPSPRAPILYLITQNNYPNN